MQTQKNLKFGTKIPKLGILGRISKNTIVIFELSTLDFIEAKTFMYNQENQIWEKTPIIWENLG